MTLEEMIKERDRLNEEIERLEDKEWLRDGYRYFYINDGGLIASINYANDSFDQWNKATSNTFRTKKEAEAVRDAKLKLAELSFKPDWDDKNQLKYYNVYFSHKGKWEVVIEEDACQHINQYHYSLREKAIEAQPYEEVLRKAGV